MKNKKLIFLFEDISFYILIISVFVAPIFSSLFYNQFFPNFKGFIILLGVVFSFVFFIFARFFEKRILIYKNLYFYLLILINAILLINSLLFYHNGDQFFGRYFESETIFSILILLVAFYLGYYFFKDKNRFNNFIYILVLSFLLFSLINFVDIIFSLKINFLSDLVNTEEFLIFSGFILILSLISLDYFEFPKRAFFFVPLITSFLNLFIFYSKLILIISLLIVLSFLIYRIYLWIILRNKEKKDVKIKFPYISLIVFILLMFVFFIGRFYFSYSTIVEKVDFKTSFNVASKNLAYTYLLGSGPGEFQNAWDKFKPLKFKDVYIREDQNFSSFFNLLTTVGLLPAILFILFLFLTFYAFFKRNNFINKKLIKFNLFSLVSFILLFYLVILYFIYPLNYFFLFLIIILSAYILIDKIKKKDILIIENKIYLYPLLFFFLIGSFVLGFKICQKFVSYYYFRDGIELIKKEKVEEGEEKIKKALSFNKIDDFRNIYSAILINKIKEQYQNPPINPFLIEKNIYQILSNIEEIIQFDTYSFTNLYQVGDNYLFLFEIYPRNEGFLKKSIDIFKKSKEIAPNNIYPYLKLALINIILKEYELAKKEINFASQIDPQHLELIALRILVEKKLNPNFEESKWGKYLKESPQVKEILNFFDAIIQKIDEVKSVS